MDEDQKNPTPEAPSADMLAIMAEAETLDAGAAGPVQAAPAAPQTTTADDLRQALEVVRAMARPLFSDWEDFGAVWSDATLQQMAGSGGAIMDRHGWQMGEVLATWGPYIGLAASLGPATLATVQHIKLRRALAEARAKQGQQQAQQQPAEATP